MGAKGSKPPANRTLARYADALGEKASFVKLREDYKLRGMSPRDAAVRAADDMRLAERYEDHRRRKTLGELVGRSAPLTASEAKEIHPSYEAPTVTKGSRVGDRALSFPEQVRWVKQQLARVRDGRGSPEEFPSEDTLYWYQIAITRPGDFDKIVLKMESPERESEDAMLRDGEYQFSQIEQQLLDALQEVGQQLVEQEAGFAEALDGLLRVRSEGSGEQSAIPA